MDETTTEASLVGESAEVVGDAPTADDPGGECPPLRLDDASLLVNRELSQLRFFERVLEEAQSESVPLLERVKFLSILGSIIAEFFMVRVAGLKQQVEAGITEKSPDGLTPTEQLAAIRPMAAALMESARTCFSGLLTKLAKVGVQVVDFPDLTKDEKLTALEYFRSMIFPVLTPLAHDPARPFPFISNMSLNLAVMVRDQDGAEHFARVKVPNTLPRVIPVGESRGKARLVWLEQVVAAYLMDLFPGMEIVESHQFRVTRDAEVAIQELEAEDLLETVERSVRRRRFGSVVRLVIDRDTPDSIKTLLRKNLQIGPDDVYEVSLPLAMSDLGSLFSFNRPDLKDASFVPADPVGLEGVEGHDLFAAIRQGDILLHHPYESFQPVIDFLETAAKDPDVLAIKQTLYRVGKNAPIVAALLEAARRGKQVAVLVELKARFDEESNIEWARMLEHEGVHVIYGLPGFKTHCKVALVVRREGDGIRRYVHLATGNYNAVTATQYTDLGMFTAREDYGADASDLFNYLTGYSRLRTSRKLMVAPFDFRTGVERLIDREIEHGRSGKKGHLIFKINSLVDKRMIALLYEASQAGVKVELVIRGICCLRPGLAGISENITVRSIVGRFLEHSRILYFDNDGSPECYLGSADLMPRNLDKRVEVLFPVEAPALVERLRNEILGSYLADNLKARIMQPDGTYTRAVPAAGEPLLDCQAHFLALSARRSNTLVEGQVGPVSG